MRNSTQQAWSRAIVGALCALVLLAHAALALHKTALAHSADDACEYCLAAGNLSGTVPVSLPDMPFARDNVVPLAVIGGITAVAVRAYDGRAPPTASA